MAESTHHQNSDKKLEELQLLWEEYKYRHDLVWRVIFQLTAAIVILSVIPYINRDIVQVLKWGILSAPVLSIALIIFGFFLVNNELDLFHKIKDEYRERQTKLFPKITHEHGGVSVRQMVRFYFISILVLSLVNLFVVLCVWIPKVTRVLCFG
jgi:hypothetical protein